MSNLIAADVRFPSIAQDRNPCNSQKTCTESSLALVKAFWQHSFVVRVFIGGSEYREHLMSKISAASCTLPLCASHDDFARAGNVGMRLQHGAADR